MRIPRQKIVLIPAWYPQPDQPVNGIFIHDQARCLATRHDVTVIIPHKAIETRRSITEEMVDDVRVIRTPIRAEPAWKSWLPAFLRPSVTETYYQDSTQAVTRAFDRHVKEHGVPNVLHAHIVLPSGWIAQQLGSRWNIPVVVTEHSGPFTAQLGTLRQRQLARHTLLGVNRVLAVSPALARNMQICFPEVSPFVLGNVIRTDFFTPGPDDPPQKCRFFSLALLVEGKGIQHLLEAAAILRGQGFVDFEIIIGGDGPFRSALEESTDRLGLRTCCRFTGLLDRTQVREQMRQCDVFVLPSLSETFCLVLCEAMACGKPVISTRCGGPEFTVTDDTGVLVSTSKPFELADIMAGFLLRAYSFDSKTIRQSVVSRFGVDAFLDQLDAVYSEIQGQTLRQARAA